jgi:hypothetical protein
METLRLAILSVLLATGCGSTKVVAVPAVALEDADPRPLPWNPHVCADEYALYDVTPVNKLTNGSLILAIFAIPILTNRQSAFVIGDSPL